MGSDAEDGDYYDDVEGEDLEDADENLLERKDDERGDTLEDADRLAREFDAALRAEAADPGSSEDSGDDPTLPDRPSDGRG